MIKVMENGEVAALYRAAAFATLTEKRAMNEEERRKSKIFNFQVFIWSYL